MVDKILDTTNKLISQKNVSESDDNTIKQLSDNLQDITTEDIDSMCDEIDEAKSWKFEILWEVDWSGLEFEHSKRIVKWKWKTFDLNTQSWEKDFMTERTGRKKLYMCYTATNLKRKGVSIQPQITKWKGT